MDSQPPLLVFLFFLTWLVGVGGFFYGLYEIGRVRALYRDTFVSGRIILRESRSGLPPPAESLIGRKTNDGKTVMHFVSEDEVIFTYRLPFGGIVLHTFFPLKGVLRWTDEGATLTARAPVGPTVFIFAFMLGWLIGGLAVLVSGQASAGEALTIFPGIVLLVYAFYRFSMFAEKRRARWALEAVERELRAQR